MEKSSLITTIILISSFSISLAEAEPAAPNTKPPTKKRKGLLERSTILAHNGNWTLLPKGAVIHTPDHLKNKIASTPGRNKIITWKPFLQKNHGWIHTYPISKEQARGTKKISPAAIKAYKTMGKLVVATHNGNPISVNPTSLKPETEESK